MQKSLLAAALIVSGASPAMAEKAVTADSLLNYKLGSAEITATRATSKTPIALTNLDKKDIAKRNFGQDIPYLLLGTPSIITTSDAGAGIGYTSIRVRGTDASRINVTNNGIPINDAESSSVFWVNMPDLISSIKDIQIQRGVGTSTNGSGAFGASINMMSAELNAKPYGEFQGSYGSFNSHKETLKFGTGLINGHWTLDGRLSNIGSDGYLDRAESSLNSYYFQGGYFDKSNAVKFILHGGKEKTYHAWNYSTREQMEAFGRKFNSCGYMNGTTADGKTERPDVDYDIPGAKEFLDAGGHFNFYDEQTDNYLTTNAQLLYDHIFNPNWKMNVSLHYTKGDGYYQEYKDDRKLYQFGLEDFVDNNGTLQKRSDLIRKKGHDSHFGGAIASLEYNNAKWHATLGGGYNYYENEHYGKVLWVKNYIGNLNPNDDYYNSVGKKNDGNIFIKAEYEFFKGLTAYADVQYRHIRYRIDGQGDKWNGHEPQLFNIDDKFDFCNPKIGLNWEPNAYNRIFASVSMAHKEPTRNNYTDGYINDHPTSEQLIDYELGYTFANKWMYAGANLYFMDYKDQLVLTGELNEVGEAVAANVPDSYRAGIELMAGLKLPCGFSWDINATISRNRIKNFSETLYGHDENWEDLDAPIKINHGDTHIAFSPDFIFNNRFGYTWKGLETSLQTQYVSSQYMSNADIDEHKLDSYFVSNLNLSYTFNFKNLKALTIGATVYNIFNEEYENNGWASSDFTGHIENGKVVMDRRGNYAGYAAQAGTNFMFNIGLKF